MAYEIAVIYSSRHGHVAEIARRLGDVIDTSGGRAIVRDAAERISLPQCDAAIVLGSIHFGRHSAALRRFVEDNLSKLADVPSGFMSVSGAAASIQGVETARKYAADFLNETRWEPDTSACVAGAILFSRYGWLTKRLMQFSSRIAGRESDPSRDYVYTDWFAVDAFAHEVIDLARHRAHRALAVGASV